MDVSRRGFLKISGVTALAGGLGVTVSPGTAQAQAPKIVYTKETTTICPYCAVGCGIIVHTRDGKVVNTEGDPDHPINQGSLCPKGVLALPALGQPESLDQAPLPGALRQRMERGLLGLGPGQDRREYQDRAATPPSCRRTRRGRRSTAPMPLPRWAARPWTTRSATFIRNSSAALGLVYIEHQARI